MVLAVVVDDAIGIILNALLPLSRTAVPGMGLQNQHEYIARVMIATPMDAMELQVEST